MLKVKGGRLCLDETDVDYIRFGSGVETLIMLPGLGDGLHTVRGTAMLMSLLYRKFGKKYSVYMLSGKNKLPAGYSTNQMAEDVFRKVAIEISVTKRIAMKRDRFSIRGIKMKESTAQIVPMKIKGVRLPNFVFVLSDNPPNRGSKNTASMLSSAIMIPDSVWLIPYL